MGEFWDGHDFTELDKAGSDVDFEVTCAVPIEVEPYSLLEEQTQ